MNVTDRNEFKVKGRMVSERESHTDDTVIITLIVKNDYRDIFPEIRCKKSMVPEHKDHSVLEITGYIASDHNVPRLYATKISLAAPILEKEFGVKGRFWEPDNCYYYVTGMLVEINEDNSGKHPYVRYLLETKKPDSQEDTKIRIDWKKIDRHPSFVPGDNVCAVCKINTPQKMIGTEKRHFLNLDVFDMEKISNQ